MKIVIYTAYLYRLIQYDFVHFPLNTSITDKPQSKTRRAYRSTYEINDVAL